MSAFQPLTNVAPGESSLKRPFVALVGSMAVIVGSAALCAWLAADVAPLVESASRRLRETPMVFALLAVIVVAVNLFEAAVHVINAIGLWFNRALTRAPWALRLAQHVEHLERRPHKGEYLALNGLDAAAFAGAFIISGRFGPLWGVLFGPHLATMALAAWDLDRFLRLYLLDIRRHLPPSATATRPRRALLRVHFFARGAFVLTDAVARTYLCGVIAFG